MSTTAMPPFHLAFPIADIEETRAFYQGLLGCKVGREAERWIDFDFFGHQISAHIAPDELNEAARNPVDGKQVPVRHFGAVLAWDQWQELATKLKAAECTFVIEPYVRFAGEPGEQGTFFVRDPAGNCLEFKSFKEMDRLFAS